MFERCSEIGYLDFYMEISKAHKELEMIVNASAMVGRLEFDGADFNENTGYF